MTDSLTTPLTPEQIREKLTSFPSSYPSWEFVDGFLRCDLTFPNFADAFSFMTKAALVSEQIGHHPEWTNVYNRVSIKLCTHDAKGVTNKDILWIENTFSHR